MSTLDEWVEYVQTVHFRSIDMSLERVTQVYRRLGPDPVNTVVITVGGTNGKGSSVAMLESVYGQAGYSTAAFTSPHLVEFNERFRFNGQNLADGELVDSFRKIESLRKEIPLTYFEFATLVAIDCLLDKSPDVLIMETGMGGRLDSVNVLDPDCVLITHVALDHIQWLGTTREQIGMEKAGLLRPQVDAVYADTSPAASVLNQAEAVGAQLKLIQRDFNYTNHVETWDWHTAGNSPRQFASLPLPGIPGTGQIKNAAGVVMVIEALEDRLPVAEEALRRGLAGARIAGRLQTMEIGHRQVLLDVAHNENAVQELENYLRDHTVTGKNIAVLGMLGDKDIEKALAPIFPCIGSWHLATLDEPRGATSQELARLLLQVGGPVQYNCHSSPVASFEAAVREANNGDRVVVFGSFHTVGAILSHNKR